MTSRKLGAVRALVLILLALALSTAITACDDDSAGPETGVSVEEVIASDGERLAGQIVTVSGRLEEVITPRAFWLRGDERVLLVVAPAAQRRGIREGAALEVTGEVRLVAAARPGELPLDRRGFVDYEAPTYLAADEIDPRAE